MLYFISTFWSYNTSADSFTIRADSLSTYKNIDIAINMPEDKTLKKYSDLKNVVGVEKITLYNRVGYEVEENSIKVTQEFKTFKWKVWRYEGRVIKNN